MQAAYSVESSRQTGIKMPTGRSLLQRDGQIIIKDDPVFNHHVMRTYERLDVRLHAFLTSALHVCELSGSRLGRFISRGKDRRYTLDGIAGAGLDIVMKRKIEDGCFWAVAFCSPEDVYQTHGEAAQKTRIFILATVRTRKLNEKYSSLCQEKNSGRP